MLRAAGAARVRWRVYRLDACHRCSWPLVTLAEMLAARAPCHAWSGRAHVEPPDRAKEAREGPAGLMSSKPRRPGQMLRDSRRFGAAARSRRAHHSVQTQTSVATEAAWRGGHLGGKPASSHWFCPEIRSATRGRPKSSSSRHRHVPGLASLGAKICGLRYQGQTRRTSEENRGSARSGSILGSTLSEPTCSLRASKAFSSHSNAASFSPRPA